MHLPRLPLRSFVLAGAAADLLRPDDLPLLLVNSQQQQPVVGRVRRHKDAIAPNYWRARAPLGQRAFPDNAPLLVPYDRHSLFAANARSLGAAPLRPIFGSSKINQKTSPERRTD